MSLRAIPFHMKSNLLDLPLIPYGYARNYRQTLRYGQIPYLVVELEEYPIGNNGLYSSISLMLVDSQRSDQGLLDRIKIVPLDKVRETGSSE